MFKGPLIEVEVRAQTGGTYKEWLDSDQIVMVSTIMEQGQPVLGVCGLTMANGLQFHATEGKRELAKRINRERRDWYARLSGVGDVPVAVHDSGGVNGEKLTLPRS